MPLALVNDDKYILTATEPEDGDQLKAISVNVALEALWKSRYAFRQHGLFDTTFSNALPPYPAAGPYTNLLDYRIGGTLILEAGAAITYAPPRTFTRGPRGIFSVTVSATQWLAPTNTFDGDYEQGSDVTTGSPIVWIMDVPPEATVTGAALRLTGQPVHGAVLPNTVPKFVLYIIDQVAGTVALVPGSTTSDPSNIGTYETPHQFSSGVLNAALGADAFLAMAVYGEFGGSAAPGLKVASPTVSYTVTSVG